jgi:choline dehydrogenase-like flavoprotein
MIVDPNSIEPERTLKADVCIIGSGAGGAVAAMELAEAGLRVVVLEEGRYSTSRDFSQRETEMIPLLYREQWSRATADFSVLVAQGRTVGGSTVPSFCLAFRPPAAILDHWEQRLGLPGLGSALMAPHFERVERLLGVRPTAESDVNANNARARDGAVRLGLRGRLPRHSRVDCVGCGFCALGCAYDRKNDALTVHLPAASRAGAVVLPQCRADTIEVREGRVAAVRCEVARDDGRVVPLAIEARAVVLAAGAIASPRIWLRSQLPDAHRQVGRHLRLHPQVVVQGIFDDEIEGWAGVPQSYVIDHFLGTEVGGGGFLMTPTFAPPVTAASLTPGFGANHRRLMESYARVAMLAVTLHDRTEGRVVLDDGGRPAVRYHLVEDDRADLLEGIQRAGAVLFAAGARRVVLPFTERVELESAGELAGLDRSVRANDPLLVSYQPHGTLRMGTDPRRSVTRATGEAHEVRGLWVADASLPPTALAVPPQLTVMALATRVAGEIAASLRHV